MSKLDGKVAVITGSTSGIGRACAVLFAEEGARVVVTGRRRAVGRAVAESIGEAAIFVPCDVTREADIKALIETTISRFGRIDCLVNNAGAGSNTASIAATDPKAFDYDIALHVRAPFVAMKYAAPALIAGGTGAIINVSSISATCAGFNTFGYEVAKAALVHLTRCAALEFGEKGVRANSISPGPTLTGIFAKLTGSEANAADLGALDIEAGFAAMLPPIQSMPGMIHAEDIAKAALFLASDEARYVNGHDLIVDGGIAAGRPASTMQAGWQALARLCGALTPD
jgi:NAD(P)-dependent dehydrogenase (short-subunit alcohol dehydrogenase family)